jgi:hypothetical protein
MIEISRLEVSGLANALYGMRLPKNSNYLSDTLCVVDCNLNMIKTIHLNDVTSNDKVLKVIIGEKDKKLASTLLLAGTDHGKWFRQIQLSMLIKAPMTAWYDIDTYKVSTVRNSSSRMHKITSRPLNISDFSFDDTQGNTCDNEYRKIIIRHINRLIELYNNTKNMEEKENIFRRIIQDLPQSYNFTSMYTCSAQTARSFYFARKNHKQKELRDLANFFANLPNEQLVSYFITLGAYKEV